MDDLRVQGSESRPLHSGTGAADALTHHIASVPYRPDIDGLRGIAVAFVIAFHFGVWPFAGGFIGVDIFFVISGFLITSLLAQSGGDLLPTLDDFYRRRIVRLMPMFLIVALAAAVAVTILFAPDDFTSYFQSITQALVFRANQHFDHVTHTYFSESARELPLLHVWSLSIEWQFYLGFPVLFLLARKFLPRTGVALAIACVAVWCFYVSVTKTGHGQQAYFLGSARYFEPLIGCVAAFVTLPAGKTVRMLVTCAALAALTMLSIVYSEATPFPGLNAALVCALAAVVIIAGRDNAVLAVRPLVHLGRISYSAYLWHWPPLAFLAYTETPLSPLLKALLIGGVLVLAHLSYVLVERPSRHLRDWPLWRLVTAFIIVPLVAAAAVKEVSERNDGFYQRLGSEAASIHQALEPYLDRGNCLYFRRNDGQDCRLGEANAAPSFYLIGDSHAGHYRWFVDTLAKDAGVGGISVTRVQCLMAPGSQTFARDPKYMTTTESVLKRIEQTAPKYVFIGERWPIYPADDLDRLETVIGALVWRGITPVILGPIAENGKNLRNCFYRHVRLREPYRGECRFAAGNGLANGSHDRVRLFFEKMRAAYPSLVVIDVQAVQCPDGLCDPQIDGVPMYEDDDHINGYASVMLARRYLMKFGNPFHR